MRMSTRKLPINERTLMILINEVKKHRCIWNVEDTAYKDRCKVALAWEQIANLLNLPETVLRLKWKNLRDLFKREEKKSKIHSIHDYEGKWRYFNTLWFLHRSNHTDNISGEESLDKATDITVKEENELEDLNEVLIENNINNRGAPENNVEVESTKKRKLSDNYDTMFLQSLTPFFRDLEPWRKLVVRNKIQDIILKELAEQNNFEIPH